jgi:hypothetical protein
MELSIETGDLSPYLAFSIKTFERLVASPLVSFFKHKIFFFF